MSKSNKYVFMLAACLLQAGTLFAQDEKLDLLSRKIPVNFIPEKAVILVEFQDRSVKQYKSLLIPPMKKAEMDMNLPDWIVGTFVKSPSANPAVSYSIFLKGKQNESALLPRLSIDHTDNYPVSNSVDVMKSQIANRRKILESLQVQNNTQAANLKRLRADAEVIANLARIVEIVEETDVVKSEIENLDKDLELLRSTFQAVKSMPQPKNYLRREIELSKQSDELIKLVKATETDEESRKNLSQSDIQAKLSMIEQTRFEDEEKLRQQLIRLKSNTAGSNKPTVSVDEGQVKNYWEIQ